MRIKYLSGPFTGYEETVEQVAGEVMCQFGYAEQVVPAPPPPLPAPPSPALVEEPPPVADPIPGMAGGFSSPSPDPAGGPLFDP